MICHENRLPMKYHALFVIFEKAALFLKLSSAANYRWRFKSEHGSKHKNSLKQSDLGPYCLQYWPPNYIGKRESR